MLDSRVIVALDFASMSDAESLIEQLKPNDCKLKVGKEMFTRFGPEFVNRLSKKGFDVFLDLKFHDIPNTVAKACLSAADLGVWMTNVHTLGGQAMLEAAANALSSLQTHKPHLIGVTILTHMQQSDLDAIGIMTPLEQQVTKLALHANDCGLDGIVCSPVDLDFITPNLPNEFMYVTPGVRLEGSKQDDQKRIMTPIDAINSGSSYLVVGRPITQAKEPAQVLTQINESIRG